MRRGSDVVNEAYAEVQLPLIADKPFFNLLELDASGRYTHYQSYGSGWTYSVRGEWAPISLVRIRGNYGTNFRAPNLYEQFIADQIGFYPGNLDPCNEFSTQYSPSSTTYKNCLAELTPILDNPSTTKNEALDYFTSGSFQVTTSGGRGVLKAEKATTWGFGTVLTMPKHIADLSLAIDYWNIEVRGEIGNLGNLLLNFCYEADDFPNNSYCSFIDGRNPATDAHPGEITNLRSPYLNIARQQASGIDFDARYATDLLGGHFSTQLQATRNTRQATENFAGDGLNDYNGQLGYPGAGAGPKWVATLDTRFKTSSDITFRWGIKYVGKAKDTLTDQVFLTMGGVSCAEGSSGCFPATYDLTAEPYWEHGFSIQYLWKDVGQFTFGVNNAFDAKPPRLSAPQADNAPRFGNYFANGPYSYVGRSFFVNVTRSF